MASEFITRVERGKDEPYTVIFRTDDADKYKHIEDECRRMIGHEMPTVDAVYVVRCGECGHYHSEDDPAYCDELCTIHIEPTDGCLRGIKRGGKVGYRAADGERKDGAV